MEAQNNGCEAHLTVGTQRSHNLKKELNNYKWKQNRDGRLENEPVDFLNHSIDAVRYVCLNALNNVSEGKYSFV